MPDFRLIDYLSAPLSTDHSSALDGQLGNVDALKRDLAAQGEYDPRMAFYMLYRQRPFGDLGFSGFEARYYSLCESFEDDLARAVDLQNLVTALAFRYVARGEVTHADIPDRPTIESERRQVIFGTTCRMPTHDVCEKLKSVFCHVVKKSCPVLKRDTFAATTKIAGKTQADSCLLTGIRLC